MENSAHAKDTTKIADLSETTRISPLQRTLIYFNFHSGKPNRASVSKASERRSIARTSLGARDGELLL